MREMENGWGSGRDCGGGGGGGGVVRRGRSKLKKARGIDNFAQESCRLVIGVLRPSQQRTVVSRRKRRYPMTVWHSRHSNNSTLQNDSQPSTPESRLAKTLVCLGDCPGQKCLQLECLPYRVTSRGDFLTG